MTPLLISRSIHLASSRRRREGRTPIQNQASVDVANRDPRFRVNCHTAPGSADHRRGIFVGKDGTQAGNEQPLAHFSDVGVAFVPCVGRSRAQRTHSGFSGVNVVRDPWRSAPRSAREAEHGLLYIFRPPVRQEEPVNTARASPPFVRGPTRASTFLCIIQLRRGKIIRGRRSVCQ